MTDIMELAKRRADTRAAYLKSRDADRLVRIMAENAYLEAERAYRAAIQISAEKLIERANGDMRGDRGE